MIINSFKGDYFFLSNLYPIRLELYGVTYPSVEHYYQSMKTTDDSVRKAIVEARTASVAKRIGKNASLKENWDEIKDITMLKALEMKFDSLYSLLGRKLCLTYPLQLEEGNNWHDNYWGNCYCKKCKDIEGRNRLGKYLMSIRKELIDG